MKFTKKKEEPSHDEEMASGASIEKSIATKQQEPSSPPAYPPSKTFIRLTNGSGMTFLPSVTSRALLPMLRRDLEKMKRLEVS